MIIGSELDKLVLTYLCIYVLSAVSIGTAEQLDAPPGQGARLHAPPPPPPPPPHCKSRLQSVDPKAVRKLDQQGGRGQGVGCGGWVGWGEHNLVCPGVGQTALTVDVWCTINPKP